MIAQSSHLVTWWEALVLEDHAAKLVIEDKITNDFDRFLLIGIFILYIQ